MGSAFAILAWLVILAAVAWFLVGGGLAALPGTRRKAEGAAEDTLRYAVPEGQDPAAIIAVLAPNGYVARIEELAETRVLVIASGEDEPVDRSSVRALISQASTTIQDPAATTTDVHFLDEVA